MKKILVKLKVITQEYKAPVLNELGEVVEAETPEITQTGEQIDQAEIDDEGVEFFISQRPQYICEVIDISEEVNAKKLKESKKLAAKEALKSIDIEGANTVAKLKQVVKTLIEAME
jgi:hypothetical protein